MFEVKTRNVIFIYCNKFLIQGPGNFVGSIGEMEVKTKCPAACRPKDHPDWELC